MIKNNNGQPFKLSGSLQQFDPNDKAADLFNRYDEEIIRLSGSPIFYYEVLIQLQTVDQLYLEDRGKLFSSFPVKLFAIYEPAQQQIMASTWGLNTPDMEVTFEMNYRSVLKEIGHPPKMGSRIFTPHLRENWIILDYRLDQFKKWGALHIQLQCKKFPETTTTGEGKVTQSQPDFSVTDLKS